MINKKLVGTALVGLMTVGFAGQVLAADQNINGTDNGTMTVTGNLGEMDNTDPGEVIPDGSKEWINVTIPTEVVFASNKNAEIISPTYTIKNNSGRPVKVDIQQYKIDGGTGVDALELLKMTPIGDAEAVEVTLATEGKTEIDGTSVVATTFDKNIAAVGGTTDFKFTGTVDADKLVLNEKNQAPVNSELVFKFEALDRNGNQVTK